MRVISVKALKDFWARYPDAEGQLKAWYAEAKSAVWTSPADIKNTHGNASIIANNRVVFNIHGNRYRLIVRIAYDFGIIYIEFVGTHAQYDGIDAATVELRMKGH